MECAKKVADLLNIKLRFEYWVTLHDKSALR